MSFRQNISFIIFLTLSLSGIYAQDTLNGFDADGKRHGLWRKYFSGTKQIRYEGKFDHGKETGVFKYYTIKSKQNPVATKKFDGVGNLAEVTYYSLKQKIISTGKMKGKSREGKWTYFHKNSDQVMSEEHYSNNLLNGPMKVFYKQGQLLEEFTYKKGKRQGESKKYHQDGKLIHIVHYLDHKLHGKVTYYDPNGNVISEGNYVKGLRKGVWKFYEGGKLTETEDYDIPLAERKAMKKKEGQ